MQDAIALASMFGARAAREVLLELMLLDANLTLPRDAPLLPAPTLSLSPSLAPGESLPLGLSLTDASVGGGGLALAVAAAQAKMNGSSVNGGPPALCKLQVSGLTAWCFMLALSRGASGIVGMVLRGGAVQAKMNGGLAGAGAPGVRKLRCARGTAWFVTLTCGCGALEKSMGSVWWGGLASAVAVVVAAVESQVVVGQNGCGPNDCVPKRLQAKTNASLEAMDSSPHNHVDYVFRNTKKEEKGDK
eukprot:1139145-Pelagomonas_calceolata.AAC.6